jgi:CRP-like cAMP-binding protein
MVELLKIGSWRAGELLDGVATAEMDRVPVTELRSGYFVGSGVLAGQATEPVTLRAATDVRFMTWPKRQLAAFLKARPEMSASLSLIVDADLLTLLTAAEAAEVRAGRPTPNVTTPPDGAT